MQFTKPIRVWIHKALDEDGEAGYYAWAFPYLGFATWAETEPRVLEKIPQKLLDYLQFRRRYELPPQDGSSPSGQVQVEQVEVVERVTGNEILFSSDYQAATPQFVDETIALLDATRTELLEAISEVTDDVLDWDPPYRHFPSWAHWHTIRQILVHIANTETHYYLPCINIATDIAPASEHAPWQAYLARHREVAVEALHILKTSHDLARIRFYDDGAWSVRKALRRLVWHERLHTKSIRRIIKDYRYQHDKFSA